MRYLNQLEPDGLLQHFLSYPPHEFRAWLSEDGAPVFTTAFNLLTTMDDALQRKIAALPFFRHWKKILQPYSCFVGTTVSEYALLPTGISPMVLAEKLKNKYSGDYAFFIVKDIPISSPFLDRSSNDFSAAFSTALYEQGFIRIEGQALAWVPLDFDSIDDYLARLSSGRRKDLRRKLKKKEALEIIKLACGDTCFHDESLIDEFYKLYLNVYQQSEIHFDLLDRRFFAALLQDSTCPSAIFTYYHQGKLVGYNICFIENGMLVDKYIGLQYPAAREVNLYFISWFHNLEYALNQGLTHYIAGWTDPQIKSYLGAKFTWTQHAVYIRNPVLRMIIRRFNRFFESDRHWHESFGSK